MYETSYNNLQLLFHDFISILEKNVYKQTEKKLICNTFLFGEVFSKSNLQVTCKYTEH